MMEDGQRGFCMIPSLVKCIIKCLLEVWMEVVQVYLEKYEAICSALFFWAYFVWLTLRTRSFFPTRYVRHGSFCKGAIYIEELLRKMYSEGSHDPCEFPDIVKGFDKETAFMNVSGEVALHTMYMTGLKTLRLIENATLIEENGQFKLKFEVDAGRLDFHSAGRVKLMKLGPEFMLTLKIRYLQAHVEFSVDSETGRNGRLDKLVIYNMRGMNAKLVGLGFFDWFVSTILSFSMKIFGRFFHNLIEEVAESYLQRNIQNFQFPLLSELEERAAAHQEAASETTRIRSVAHSSDESRADAAARSGETDRTDATEDITSVEDSSEMNNSDLETIPEEEHYESLDTTASEMSSSL